MGEKSEALKNMSEEELNARHAEKMKKKKAARDKIIATKTIEKGLVMVHTGKGKGKSTAAFGMVFRAIGNGMRVGVVQFVKQNHVEFFIHDHRLGLFPGARCCRDVA